MHAVSIINWGHNPVQRQDTQLLRRVSATAVTRTLANTRLDQIDVLHTASTLNDKRQGQKALHNHYTPFTKPLYTQLKINTVV